MERPSNGYFVHVIFRGLFIAWPDDEGALRVLLPDARRPPRSELDPDHRLGGLREHAGVIEIPTHVWQNRAQHPNALEVRKPNKEPVALAFLEGHSLEVTSEKGTLRCPELPEAVASSCNRAFNLNGNNNLMILDADDNSGLLQLSEFRGPLRADGDLRRAMVGHVTFDRGFAQSERRSRDGDREVKWVMAGPEDVKRLIGSSATGEGEPVADVIGNREGRLLNLDLRVSLVADADDVVHLNRRFLEDESVVVDEFLLHPPEPETDVTIWIKNRELTAVLQDSDQMDKQIISDPRTKIDLDHEFYGRLTDGEVVIPVDSEAGLNSDGGAGCGGGVKDPGGP